MKIEEILFWIFLITALGLIVLRAFGSPPTETIFVMYGGIILLLWRVTDNIKIKISSLETKFARIDTKLDLIWNEFKKRKKI